MYAADADPGIMSDDERLDDIVTFFLAGEYTSNNTLSDFV